MMRQTCLPALVPLRHWLKTVCRLAFGLGVLWAAPSWSAETWVNPGTGTLAAAIAAASAGDVLILLAGTYSGAATVSKSLTIRPINMNAIALVTGGSLTIDAVGAQVTIQGLDLANTLVVKAAADVKVLENDLYNASIDVTAYKTSEGDGKLVVIGNRLHTGGRSAIAIATTPILQGIRLIMGESSRMHRRGS